MASETPGEKSAPHTLVVGGTRGVGRAFVRMMAGAGHVVSVIGRRPPGASDQAQPGVRYWTQNVLDAAETVRTLGEIVATGGRLWNLVFFQRYRGDGDDWNGELNTTLTATRDIVEATAHQFAMDGTRAIVCVGSVASQFVATEQPLSYHVARAGLNQLVRFYAVQLGSQGIRVNSVGFSTVLKEESKAFYLGNQRLLDLYRELTPLGRLGTAEEVVNVIRFLCSCDASFMTGQNLVIDGGISLQWQESLGRRLGQLGEVPVTREAGRTRS